MHTHFTSAVTRECIQVPPCLSKGQSESRSSCQQDFLYFRTRPRSCSSGAFDFIRYSLPAAAMQSRLWLTTPADLQRPARRSAGCAQAGSYGESHLARTGLNQVPGGSLQPCQTRRLERPGHAVDSSGTRHRHWPVLPHAGGDAGHCLHRLRRAGRVVAALRQGLRQGNQGPQPGRSLTSVSAGSVPKPDPLWTRSAPEFARAGRWAGRATP